MRQACMEGATIRRPWLLPFVLLLIVSPKTSFSMGGDTLSAGQSLSEGQTLLSQGQIFELGFFRPGNSPNNYLGIWFKNFNRTIKVWVANREYPLSDRSSFELRFSEIGNLVLLRKPESVIWSTNITSLTSNSTEAVLLDSGNFVLRDVSKPSNILWQSFDYPTDTWLPGASLGINKRTGKIKQLTAWKNSEDPAPSRFSYELDSETFQFFLVWNKSKRYWGSGLWNGSVLSSIPDMNINSILNMTFVENENEHYATYSMQSNTTLSRILVDASGEGKHLIWWGMWDWALFTTRPTSLSEVYALCGPFGIFNGNLSTSCACLHGFDPFSVEETSINDWSGGCVRKTALQCANNNTSNGAKNGFLKISNVKLPDNSKPYPGQSAEWCEFTCMQNCSCTAYAFNGSGCSIWEGALLNLQQIFNGDNTKQDVYIKLADSDLQNVEGNRMGLRVIIAVVISGTALTSGSFICYLCLRKHKQTGTSLIPGSFIYYLRLRKHKQTGEEYSSNNLLAFDFGDSINSANSETNNIYDLRKGEKEFDLPLFSFASISSATGNFSADNKLGEGGFGPVYKGKTLGGQEIAVKRLSKKSGQGLVEFKNETKLIAKLQHRNLVRLLGCCIEQDENILVYECMPNKSLDYFLFDSNKQDVLDWATRFRIIDGVAQGLLYLHQYSRLRIVHRDLKASNILLDSEMNPKISDFGMARIFGHSESQGNTNRIVGTYGYMAPEYAMRGLFSIKSDVFSFGVLLLEILSGKRNTGFYHSDSLHLQGHAWNLWNADRGMDLIDRRLGYPSFTSRLLRYIHIGLLCVQENPIDRPTMLDVVSMLNNEVAPLAKPKQPAFQTSRDMTNTDTSASNNQHCSINDVTISVLKAR